MNRDYTIDQLRENYKKGALLESTVLTNPIAQFKLWFDEAVNSDLQEPNAMCLSTCGNNMLPDSRIVLLKGLTEGFVFYTNYNSAKGKQLEENPNAALNFLWLPLERQVRISGKVEKMDLLSSQTYFNSRPLDSQLGAIVSNQSEVIEGREVLENKLSELKETYSANNLPPMPAHWGGFCLIPEVIEFWQGRPSRLHDRIRYSKNADLSWKIERLAP